MTAEHRQDLQGDHNLTRAGLSWQATPGTRLYVEEEYGKFDDRTGSRTVAGVESDVGKGTTAFNEYRLDGGADGLDFYRKIIKEAPAHLKKQGWLILEIGHDQAAAVTELLAEAGVYEGARIVKDLGGNDRALAARLAKKK